MQVIEEHTSGAPIEHSTGGELVYRFEGELADPYAVGLFPDGLRFHNGFDGRVVAGPLAGGRIFGLDQFVLRPDGIGVIVAPEVVELGDRRIAVDLRGYVVPPPGMELPPLETVASPGFGFPDVDLRVTGAATIRTADPDLLHLNRSVVVVEGTVNMGTRRLEVEARCVPVPARWSAG